MNIKIKKLTEDAVLPSYAHEGDACMDLTAISKIIIDNGDYGYIEYGTGLAFEVPDNHVMLLFPRSSVSNTGLILANAVGVIDSKYRGEVKARFKWIPNTAQYNVGDRIVQFMILPYPILEIEVVDELSTTERAAGGFGSSGK
jgi:dUTP pyrophosphatase